MPVFSSYIAETSKLPTHRHLTLHTGGSLDLELNKDFSDTGLGITDAYYQVEGIRYDIETLIITISGTSKFLFDGFGSLAKGTVVNGVRFFVETHDAGEVPLLGGYPYRENHEWYDLSYKIAVSAWDGTPQTLTIAITTTDGFGEPLWLNQGEKIIARLHDNFSGLYRFALVVNGVMYL